MTLSSSAFSNDLHIPPAYTCDGTNRNPPLDIHDVPQDTKSLVLIMEDPDAPAGNWIHWIVCNISPRVSKIQEDQKNLGILGVNDFGDIGYGGPCPPSGTHRYVFSLLALDTVLNLKQGFQKAALDALIQNHVLERATLTGLYAKA